MYHLAVSELPVEGFSWKFVSWTQRTFTIPKTEDTDVGVWLYCCYKIWQLRVNFLYTLSLKIFLTLHVNRRNTVYFKTLAHCVCCVWESLERVWGSECAAGGFVVGVCVSASFEKQKNNLNVSCFKNHSLVSWRIIGLFVIYGVN